MTAPTFDALASAPPAGVRIGVGIWPKPFSLPWPGTPPTTRRAVASMAERMRPTTRCDGICLTGYDVGVPFAGIAYAHPDCEEHGEPGEHMECTECGQATELTVSGGRPWCSRHRRQR